MTDQPRTDPLAARDELANMLESEMTGLMRTARWKYSLADRLMARGVTIARQPDEALLCGHGSCEADPQYGQPDEALREAAQAVVAAWVDDESGMATFDPACIDALRAALEADR